MFHKAIPLGDVHRVNNWQVANLAARNALSLSIADIGKIAWQQDTDTFYLLKNNVGPAWVPIGNGTPLLAANALALINDGSNNSSNLGTLTFNYYPTKFLTNGGVVPIVGSSIALAASTTNYVSANMQTGVVSVNAVGFPAGSFPMATVVTGASTITSITEARGLISVPSVTPAASIKSIPIAVSDETTALTTGVGKVTFRMPYAMTLSAIKGSLTVAQATGAIFTVVVKKNGVSLFSTNMTIDNTEKTTTTALTPSVLSSTALADDDEITVDITAVGDGTAKGLKVYLVGT